MKHLLLAAGLLGLASCSSSTTEKRNREITSRKSYVTAAPLPVYHISQVAHSTNLLLTTATYTGVILRDEKPARWAYGLTTRAMTPNEVCLVRPQLCTIHLLYDCIRAGPTQGQE